MEIMKIREKNLSVHISSRLSVGDNSIVIARGNVELSHPTWIAANERSFLRRKDVWKESMEVNK
jgi:hypothetical protein